MHVVLAEWLVESMRGEPVPEGEFVESAMLPLCEAAAAELRRRFVERSGFYPDLPLTVDSMAAQPLESNFPAIFAVNGALGMDDREDLELYASAKWRHMMWLHTHSVRLTLQVLMREGLLVALPVHEYFRGTPNGRLADRG